MLLNIILLFVTLCKQHRKNHRIINLLCTVFYRDAVECFYRGRTMTKSSSESITCSICGHVSIHEVLHSISLFGYSDLDTRATGPNRMIFKHCVQYCPSCHFCASSISEETANATEIIKNQRYLDLIKNKKIPQVMRYFLCSSYICEYNAEFYYAAIHYLYAAWIADDKKKYDLAISARKKAIVLFRKAIKNKQAYFRSGRGEAACLLVDLLRRSLQFEKADKLCKKELSKRHDEKFKNILMFQQLLISKKDSNAHSIQEALKMKEVLA